MTGGEVGGVGAGNCRNRVYVDGEVVCKDTGEVLREEDIVSEAEWNILRDREKGVSRERVGGPLTYTRHDMMSTRIKLISRPSRHRRRPVRGGPGASRRLRVGGTFSKEERKKIKIMRKIELWSTELGLPLEAKETVGLIIQSYIGKNDVRNEREMNSIIAAAIHKAIAFHKLPIPLKTVLEHTGVNEKMLWDALRKLNESGVLNEMRKFRGAQVTPYENLIERVKVFILNATFKLKLPHEVALLAIKIAEKFMREYGKDLHGRRPEAVAGALLYLAARLYNYKVSQKSIADALGVVESTIRKQYKYLLNNMVLVVRI
ncbi:MAG: transcription initiation factor IIB family protein [Desulfurococcales archaeon]|nr:transcription initiation factor IIB family protein [Desulfurococcales archaeon]